MRRLRHLLCILALFSTGLTTAMFGQGAPITDDAYVSSATPTANNGTSPSLVVQNPGGFSYIRFDLARVLPANTSPYPIAASMVAKATLKVYASAVTAGGTVDIYQVAGPWCEKTGGTCAAGITYNTQPTQTPILVSGSTVNIPATGAGQYYTFDVTQAVKDWINNQNNSGGYPNYGLVIKPSIGSSVSVTFESRKSTTTSHNAELHVVLSGPQGIQGPQGSQGGQGPQGPPGPQPFAGYGLQSDNLSPETLSINQGVTATVAGLNTAINAEVSNRNSAIGTAVNSETQRAQGAEATLTTNLNNETTARQNSDA